MAPRTDVARYFGPDVAELVDLGDGTTELRTGGPSLDEIETYLAASGFPYELVEQRHRL